MSTRSCPKTKLVEALRDGRLGAHERASLERHLPSCAECTELARSLDRISEALRAPLPAAKPLEHQRARGALLERAADSPATGTPVRRTARPVVVLLAAAMLALTAGLGWIGGRATSPARPAMAMHLSQAALTASLARATSIRPSDDAAFERSRKDGLDVVTLSNGTLDVTVRPLAAGERFLVRTSDAEIDVRGTSFHVEARNGKIRGIVVAQGTVEVRYAGFSAIIPSGGSWRATADDKEATPPPVASTSATPATPPAPPPPVKVATRVPRPAPAPPPAPIAMEKHDPPPPAPVPPLSQASRDFAAAMQAIDRGDYEGGARQLEAFSYAHGGDARSDEADFLRAVALQRAGRAAEAAAAARRYLDTRPRGAHRAEARSIIGK